MKSKICKKRPYECSDGGHFAHCRKYMDKHQNGWHTIKITILDEQKESYGNSQIWLTLVR